jgi:hypothetical protein
VKHGVKRDDWIVGGLALLLLLVVLALPWWHRMPAASGATVSENRPAVQAPYAWAAIIAALALLVLIVDLGVQRWYPALEISAIGNHRRALRLVLAVVAAVGLALKFLLHPSNLGFGFVFAVIFTILLLFAAFQASRDAPVIPGT